MAEETYEELMRRLYPMGLEEAQKASEELANQEMMADVQRQLPERLRFGGVFGLPSAIAYGKDADSRAQIRNYITQGGVPSLVGAYSKSARGLGISPEYYKKAEKEGKTKSYLDESTVIDFINAPPDFDPATGAKGISVFQPLGRSPLELAYNTAEGFKSGEGGRATQAGTIVHELTHKFFDSPAFLDFLEETGRNKGKPFTATQDHRYIESVEPVDEDRVPSPKTRARIQEDYVELLDNFKKWLTPKKQEKYGVRLPVEDTKPKDPSESNNPIDYLKDLLSGKKFYFMADGGPVLADRTPLLPSDPLFIQDDLGYSPEVLSDMQAADVTQGIGSLNTPNVDVDYLRLLLEGAKAIPSTVYDYATTTSPKEFVEDVGQFGSMMVEGIKEEPVSFLAETFIPPYGAYVGARDAKTMLEQAAEAEATGDTEAAERFKQLAALSASSVIPGVRAPDFDIPPLMGMVQKVKGGTHIPVDDRGTFLDEYKDAMKERGDESRPFDLATEKFSAEEMENVLNKIEKYYRDEAGTPDDPIRAMLLRGDLEPSAGDFGYKSTTFDDPNFIQDPYDFQLSNRGVTAMPPSLLSAIRTQADLADEIIVLQNQLRTLNETHTPIEMGGNPEFFGYRNAEDLQQARSLQTQIAKLSENDTALKQQTADRQFFDRTYDQALPIEGRVLLDKPGEIKRALYDSDTRKLEDKTRSELRENVAADLARRQAEYEQLSLKLNPAEPFEGFANAAELQRYRDLARGPRFPEEAAPFSAINADLRVTPIDYFRQRDFDDYSDLFEEGGPMERAMYEQEILYAPDISDLQRGGLGFLEPETFVNNLQLLDPKKVKNMSFPQMVKAGVDAQKKEFTTILKSDKPEQIAAALKNYPKLKTKLRPQILLESKGLETMLSGEKGVIVRLLRPEETELEGVLMNHSVGGYNDPAQSQYNRNRLFDIQGGKDSFLKGEKRVYSLRDPNTGQPRVTLDLAFDTETNLPLDVQQVKGLGNNENLINEDLDLIATFLKELGVNRKTHISEGNNIGLYLEDVFADTYAEGGIVSLANGGAVEHGVVTL